MINAISPGIRSIGQTPGGEGVGGYPVAAAQCGPAPKPSPSRLENLIQKHPQVVGTGVPGPRIGSCRL